jgi:hypothetical protein
MAFLPRPVTRMMLLAPEATASSTPYWMIGLSTSGSISLGCALVAGRNRVPRPAAGKTAFLTWRIDRSSSPCRSCALRRARPPDRNRRPTGGIRFRRMLDPAVRSTAHRGGSRGDRPARPRSDAELDQLAALEARAAPAHPGGRGLKREQNAAARRVARRSARASTRARSSRRTRRAPSGQGSSSNSSMRSRPSAPTCC